VIPAGATVTFRILELKEAENKDDAGTLVVRPEQITIGARPVRSPPRWPSSR